MNTRLFLPPLAAFLLFFQGSALAQPQSPKSAGEPRLVWGDSCSFSYPDNKPFEEDILPSVCDYILTHQPQARTFFGKMALGTQKSFLKTEAANAKDALRQYEADKKALLEATKPPAKDESKPASEALLRKLKQDKEKVNKEGVQIAAPFLADRKPYLSDFYTRVKDLDKRIVEEERLLGLRHDEQAKKLKEKFEGEQGGKGASSLKRSTDELQKKGADQKTVGDKMFSGDSRRKGDPARGQPGKEGLARLGKDIPGGDQWRKSNASVDHDQSKYANPNPAAAPPALTLKNDTAGGSANEGALKTVGRYGRDLTAGITSTPPKEQLIQQFTRERIIAGGASPEAVRESKKVIGGMLQNAQPQVVQNMLDDDVYVVIKPKGKKLTDLPEFTQYRGYKTLDGRPFETVAGMADLKMKSGGVACIIGEENLVGKGPNAGGYTKDYLATHEFGHMVQFHGLPKTRSIADSAGGYLGLTDPNESAPTVSNVSSVHNSVLRNKGTSGLGPYADTNENEHFAQATAAYFGRGYNDETASDLYRKDPQMYEIMRRTYGEPTNLG